MEHSASRTRLESLFHDALEVPPAERSDFLARACSDDLQLREQVQALITAFEQETGFLETPVLETAGTSVSQMLCALGQVLGHYRILQLLGRGGMGDVYLAEDNTLGRKVALKLLPLRLSATKTALARFWLEARSASALNHPNIMTVFEIGDEQGLHYIASEYVEGSTVRQLLAKGPLSLEQILSIALQATEGLAAAHAAGIIHRDIKPENIMVRPDGYVKILDFGLAKLTENGTALLPESVSVPGILLGTVGYMSPEQARGLDLDTRSDLFSLGTVIYEMATGKCPFIGKTPSDALSSILHGEPPSMAEASPLLPPELAALVARLLSKDRENRYPTAEALIADLKRLQQELTSRGPQILASEGAQRVDESALHPAPSTKSVAWRGAVLGLTLLLLVLGAVALFRPRTGNQISANQVSTTAQKWGFNCRLHLQTAAGQEAGDIVLPSRAPLKLAAGQQFKIYFSSPEPGYLYLLNQSGSSDGKPADLITLFPSPTANGGSPLVPASQEIAVPQESWLQVDQEKGTEQLWVVWSATDLPMLDGLEQKYANVRNHGLINSAADAQAIGNFLQANYQPEKLDLTPASLIAVRGSSRMLVWRMNLEHD